MIGDRDAYGRALQRLIVALRKGRFPPVRKLPRHRVLCRLLYP